MSATYTANETTPSAARRCRFRKVALAGMVCVAAGAWLCLVRPGRSTPPEVARSFLVLVDGRLRLKGQTNAFTGVMVERFGNGSCKSRSSVSNGLVHGLSEGWHPNGQRQVAEHFTNGVAHGLRTKWYEDGQLLSQTTIAGGKLNGVYRRWWPEGRLAEVLEMKDGEPDGLSRAFYPSGFLKAEARLRQGEIIESKFWPDGRQESGIQTARNSGRHAPQ